MKLEDFPFEYHRHVFSSWCAATAARASSLCRFKIVTGKKIIEQSSLYPTIDFPDSQLQFDRWHDDICAEFINKAKELNVNGFSYGVAAKLLNCYLKAFYISSENDSAFLHPPIDRVLLTALAQNNFSDHKMLWKELASKGWSKFSRDDYRYCIHLIRESLPQGAPLWHIERYWPGHQ